MPLDPQAKIIIDLVESTSAFELTSETPPQRVRELFASFVVPSQVACATVEDCTIPGPAGEIPVRIYRPAGDAPKPVIVYYHGGGWVIGGLDTHDGTCRLLATSVDAVVVSVDYRLAPEHVFPAAVDDAFTALQWVHAHAAELGGDPGRLAVAGDSAGGNLSAVVAQLARDAGGPPLCFQLLVYPATDYGCDRPSMTENAAGYFLTVDAMNWFFGHYLRGPEDGDDPRVSPLRSDDLAGLPPAFVITAEFDPLRDQGIAYAEAMRAAGVTVNARNYEGMFHGFFGMTEMMDVAKVALDDAAAELRAAFGEA
jgi:acetyl esterase